MSFTRVNAGSWATGARLTSAQMNQLDIDHADSVDCTTLSLGGTQTVQRVLWVQPVVDLAANWSDFATGNGGPGRIMTAVSTLSYCYFPVHAPFNSHWTLATIYVAGVGYSSLPATMPRLGWWTNIPSAYSNTLSIVADQVDTSANVGAFNAGHTISIAPSQVMNNAGVLNGIRFDSSASTNSVSGFKIYGLAIEFTMSALDVE